MGSHRRAAVGLGCLGISVWTAAFALWVMGGPSPARGELFPLAVFGMGLWVLATSLVGAVLGARRPDNPIGWLLSIAGLSSAAAVLASEYAAAALVDRQWTLPAGEVAAWLGGWLTFPGAFAVTILLPLLFPSGRLHSSWSRAIAGLATVGVVLVLIGAALAPGPLSTMIFILPNPFGIEDAPALVGVRTAGVSVLIACALGAATSLLLRLRAARGIERQQLKWFTYAATLTVLASTAMLAQFLSSGYDPAAPPERLAALLVLLAWAGLPVAVGVAILRHHLYDIDRLINRTLVYGALTAALGLSYWISVVLLQQALHPVTQGSELAVIASTLAVSTLVQPARRHIQAIVDHRFYRAKYDAERTVRAFSARLREEIDLDTLSVELNAVVHETMQPAHTALWLRRPERARE
jgi:hypothetical protein